MGNTEVVLAPQLLVFDIQTMSDRELLYQEKLMSYHVTTTELSHYLPHV